MVAHIRTFYTTLQKEKTKPKKNNNKGYAKELDLIVPTETLVEEQSL